MSDRVEEDADALADIFLSASRQQRARRVGARNHLPCRDWRDVQGHLEHFSRRHLMEGAELSAGLDYARSLGWRSHSVNGIPTGTTYTIAFGDRHSEAVVELKKQDIYSTFIEKLWRAVCVRLLTEMLEALKAGRDLHFGDALLHDDGITLVKRKFLGSTRRCGARGVRSMCGAPMVRSASEPRTTRRSTPGFPTFTGQTPTSWSRPFAWASRNPGCAD